MRCITRIHLSDCGWREAYYPGTTIDLTDPRTGKPKHTLFSLENTGGKTSFLSLVLSCFDTSERRFLKTLIRSNQKFGDYFGDVPAFILVEWDLSGGQANFLESERLVTGQVVVPRGEGQQRELNRRFFTFRSAPRLAFDGIPAPGLSGFEEHGRLNGHQDVQRWLHEMRSSYPGNFQDFVNQSDWKRKLAEEKIDTELLAAQVEFNRSEGGIEDFLNFRNESQFVRKFLAMTLPDTEAVAVHTVLAEHVGKLSDLPRLERRRDTMRQLKERFAPFVEIADKAQAAQAEVSRRIRHAASLRAALDAYGSQVARQAANLAERASKHKSAAKEAEAKCREGRVLHASATVEMARRRHEVAEALVVTREGELEHARMCKRLLAGAVSMRDILDDRTRSNELGDVIDAQHTDLQPWRDTLRGIGADLRVTLDLRAVDLRERQRARTAEAEELKSAARQADKERTAADEGARAERQKAARIEENLDQANKFRAALEQEQVVEPGEIAEAASQRHVETARIAGDEAREFRRQADTKDREAKEHLEHQSEFKAEQAGLQGELGSARELVREGETKRRGLAFDSTILKLTGESEVDPEADGVARVLADARSKCAGKLRENERRQELLEAHRESLDTTGLASIDNDVRAVADQLVQSGIPDAQPYAAYLSDILRSPRDVRRFAEIDPSRFAGVAVPNRNALESARQELQSRLSLSRPVTVALAGDVPGDTRGDRFVLPVDEPAAYDRAAAKDMQRRIEDDLTGIAEAINEEQERIQRLESTIRDLDTWRERFGGGRLDTGRREVERREARIADIRGEMNALSQRVEDDERNARACRDRAREKDEQVHVCSERAHRAREHHENWESHVEEWRVVRLRHEQSARSDEQRARDKEAERDAHTRGAHDREGKAREAAEQAANIEREAGDIAYTKPGGRESDNLDRLRRDYKRNLETLKSLEEERVDRLRGQKDEIDRALAAKEERFKKEFGDLGSSEVEVEAARDGVRDAAAAADADLETARRKASGARGDADAAGREYRSEKERRASEVRPEPLADMRTLETENIDSVAQRAEQTILEQQSRSAGEAGAASRVGEEAARNERTATECQGWVATLGGVLDDASGSPERMDLPRGEELGALVAEAVSGLGRVRDALNEARKGAYQSYDEIRRFTSSDTFRQLDSEREVAAHLRANDALAAAANARRTAGLIDDRLKTIEHDLSRLDDDLQACVEELERLLSTALHIVRRMIRDGRIPDHVPRFGGQPVFRMSADLSRVAAAQRKEILRSYVTDLAEAVRVPETGQDVAAELVDHMTAALGRRTLGIRLLKPKGEGDTEHMPIDRVTVSGGELLTAAMMIYLVLARLRADSMHGRAGEAGVLIMDNPLGKANKALLLKTQIGLADAMGIQLFYTTGVQDTSALAEFENIVRLRRNSQSRGTRRIHVEAMRTHIDKRTVSEGATAGAAK